MVKPITLGFVGCGFVAQQCHLPCFSSNPNFQITHLADPFADLRSRIATAYSIPNVSDSHHAFIGNSDIDAVVVTLPRKLTYNVVRELVLDNKFVLAEKPLCLNSSYGYELLSLLDGSSFSVMTGYMKQHDLGFQCFRKHLQSIDMSDIISIKAHCHMGDSYASPFGDIKGTTLVPITYSEQLYPVWLDEPYHWAFEQFINVFSHLTHALESLFNVPLQLQHVSLNQHGEGFVLCSLNSIPVCLDLLRGTQHQWNEGIVVSTRSSNYSIHFPPAFLRNTPAKVTIADGDSSCNYLEHLPKWSWSFYEQTKAFYSFIRHPQSKHLDLIKAVNQVKLAEQIFKHIVS